MRSLIYISLLLLGCLSQCSVFGESLLVNDRIVGYQIFNQKSKTTDHISVTRPFVLANSSYVVDVSTLNHEFVELISQIKLENPDEDCVTAGGTKFGYDTQYMMNAIEDDTLQTEEFLEYFEYISDRIFHDDIIRLTFLEVNLLTNGNHRIFDRTYGYCYQLANDEYTEIIPNCHLTDVTDMCYYYNGYYSGYKKCDNESIAFTENFLNFTVPEYYTYYILFRDGQYCSGMNTKPNSLVLYGQTHQKSKNRLTMIQ